MIIKTERGWIPLTHQHDQHFGLFAKPVIVESTGERDPFTGYLIREPHIPPAEEEERNFKRALLRIHRAAHPAGVHHSTSPCPFDPCPFTFKRSVS